MLVTPVIPTLRRLTQVDTIVSGHSELHSKILTTKQQKKLGTNGPCL
jgi:hypothetical protein